MYNQLLARLAVCITANCQSVHIVSGSPVKQNRAQEIIKLGVTIQRKKKKEEEKISGPRIQRKWVQNGHLFVWGGGLFCSLG
jgi:hypothetical protein